ncbi:MAG: YcxB family protein [Eubacteriales bacterium]
MNIDVYLSKKKYSRLVFRELLFARLFNPIIIILYLEFWQVCYAIAKFGNLNKNLPVFAVVSVLLLVIILEMMYAWLQVVRNSVVKESCKLEISQKGIEIYQDLTEGKIFLGWKELTKVRENKRGYVIYFHKKIMLPVSKESIPITAKDEFEAMFQENKKIYKRRYSLIIVLVWSLITLMGLFAIGKSAVNLNGKLSWFIHSLQHDTRTELQHNNIFEIGLEDILEEAEQKVELTPHLIPNSFSLEFTPDGRIQTLDMYAYGYDDQYQLKSGYLFYYDQSKSHELTIRVQDFETQSDEKVYNANKDIIYLMVLIKQIPIQEEVAEWTEEAYGLLYKGYYSWGYNTEGIRLIDKNGKITIPEIAYNEIIGHSLSLYCVGKTESITPKRFVFQGIIPTELEELQKLGNEE